MSAAAPGGAGHDPPGSAYMKTRIGVIGTSGSLMVDGWCDRLAQTAPGYEVVGNASLGSSHPAMLPYRLPLLNDVGMDVLVIDLCVNEQRALNRNLHDDGQTTQLFDWLRAWCATRGVLPVVLILPHLGEADVAASAIRDAWVARCRAAGLPWLDVYRLIRNASFYSRLRPRNFFLNPSHLNQRGSDLVTDALSLTLSRFLSDATLDAASAPVHPFRFVHAGGAIERRSTLLSERLLRLECGDAAVVEVGSGTVTGIVHDMNRSSAALLMAGQQTVVKRLDSPFFGSGDKMWLVAWSVLNAVGDDNGAIALSVQPAHPMAGQEDNDHSRPLEPPQTDSPAVEIAGLILRDAARPARIATCRGGQPDLLSYLA